MNQQPKPFNLEAAKNGAEILWDGKPCKFIAHVPDNDPVWRVVVAQEGRLAICTEDGRGWAGEKPRLTMATRKEKAVGYREYYTRVGGELYRCHAWENHSYLSPEVIERESSFIRWIHTEWQYDEVEL